MGKGPERPARRARRGGGELQDRGTSTAGEPSPLGESAQDAPGAPAGAGVGAGVGAVSDAASAGAAAAAVGAIAGSAAGSAPTTQGTAKKQDVSQALLMLADSALVLGKQPQSQSQQPQLQTQSSQSQQSQHLQQSQQPQPKQPQQPQHQQPQQQQQPQHQHQHQHQQQQQQQRQPQSQPQPQPQPQLHTKSSRNNKRSVNALHHANEADRELERASAVATSASLVESVGAVSEEGSTPARNSRIVSEAQEIWERDIKIWERDNMSAMVETGAAAAAAASAAASIAAASIASANAAAIVASSTVPAPPPPPYPSALGDVTAPASLERTHRAVTDVAAHVIKEGKRAGLSSQYRGVCFQSRYKHWEAQIKVKGRKQHLGYFKDELEAARAYETALAKLRPEGPRQFTSQYLGVNWNKHKSKWEVKVRVQGRQRHVGFFKDELEASQAYQTASARVRRGEPHK